MFIPRLLEAPKREVLLWSLPFSIAVFLALGAKMGAIGQALRPHGIIEFEMTWTVERARQILTDWSPAARQAMRSSVLFDFPFIPAYVALLGALCLLTARAVSGGAQAVGPALAVLAVVAGLLDVVENLCLLRMLDGPPESPSALLVTLASWAAAVKFALVFGCIFYVLTSGAPALVSHLAQWLRPRAGPA